MALVQSDQATGLKPQATFVDRASFDLVFTMKPTAAVLVGDIVELGELPPGLTPVSVSFGTSTGVTVAGTVGYLNAGKTAIGASLGALSGTAALGTATAALQAFEAGLPSRVLGITGQAIAAGKRVIVHVTCATEQ